MSKRSMWNNKNFQISFLNVQNIYFAFKNLHIPTSFLDLRKKNFIKCAHFQAAKYKLKPSYQVFMKC